MSGQATKLEIIGAQGWQRSSGRRLRLAVRWLALAIAAACVAGWLPWAWTPMFPAALSPWVAAASLLATRVVGVSVWAGLPVLVLAILRRRWFCRYACPTGLLAECAGVVRRSAAPPASRFPHVGHWIAVITLAGAAVGYPLLLWLDPLVMFTGFVGGCTGPTTDRAARWLMAGLPLVLVVSLLWPGLWCLRLCPLGATQELLALPKRWLRHRAQPATSAAAPRHGTWRLTRRVVLASGAGAAWAWLVLRHKGAARPSPLRPPGSVAEPQFTGLCLRCGNCARACPSKIIVPEVGQGMAAFLAPVVRFESGYCLEDCRRCTLVCPSGAIAPLSLEDKRHTPLGLARVDMDVCLLADEKECALCRNRCPYDAIRIVFSEADYLNTPVVDAARCPGCGACEAVCPTSPVKAIRVISPIDICAGGSKVGQVSNLSTRVL